MTRRSIWALAAVGAILVLGTAYLARRPLPVVDPPVRPVPDEARQLESTATAHDRQQRVLELVAGYAAEHEITGGQVHVYPLNLIPGHFLDLVVDQRGADVSVTLYAPDGRRLTRVDSPNGTQGPEPLPILAEEQGVYRVEVRSGERSAPGRYAVRIMALRPAAAEDRLRIDAERSFAGGEELRRQRDGASLRRALTAYDEAHAGFATLGDRARAALALYRQGRIYGKLGEYRLARRLYLQALPLWRAEGSKLDLANVLTSLGRAHRALGDPQQALATYREALALNRALGHRRGELVTLNNLGKAYDSLGEIDQALAHFDQAAVGFRELDDSYLEAVARNNLGLLYASRGDTQSALDAFEHALALLGDDGDDSARGDSHAGLGIVRGKQGDLDEALASLGLALEIYRREGDRLKTAVTLHNVGWLHKGLNRSQLARSAFEESLEIFRKLGDRRSQAVALTQLGGLKDIAGEYRAAVLDLRAASSLYEAVGDLEGEATALVGLARAESRHGDLTAAIEMLELALEKIESQRHRSSGPALRATYLASRQGHYELYVDLLMELHRHHPAAGWQAKAFTAGERRRARGLLDALVEAKVDLRRGVDSVLLEREAALEHRLATLERRRLYLLEELHQAPLRAVNDELRSLLRRYDRVQAEIRQASPGYAALTAPRPLTPTRVRERILDPSTLLLAYSLGEKRSFLFALTSSELASFELPSRRLIEQEVRRAYLRLSTSYRRTARASAELSLDALGEILLEPVARLLRGKRRLLVIADGALHYLPFAALTVAAEPTAEAGGKQRARQPLIAEHEIVRLPSISVLELLRRERPVAPATLAIIADPVYATGDPRLAEPSTSPPASSELPRTPAPSAQTFPRLPFASQEAAAILELATGHEVFSAIGTDASRELVTGGNLSRYRLLHFAVHGVLDAAHPETSGIVLSMFDPAGMPQHGFLPAREIYGLDVAADLVVLSACQTALGKEVRGEGLVGLTQAFFHAGAAQLLVSLWQVDDQATAELMRRFYRALLEKRLPAAAALRAAQIDLRQEGRWQAPYFWAGFVLQGNNPSEK